MEILLRSAWIDAWRTVSLNTQISGPNTATVMPGQMDGGGTRRGLEERRAAETSPGVTRRAITRSTRGRPNQPRSLRCLGIAGWL